MTTSQQLGASTSEIEVTSISAHGIWLYFNGKEYFLSNEDFPWFKSKKIEDVLDVQVLSEEHIHWPALDIDLTVDMLDHPGRYPLTYRE